MIYNLTESTKQLSECTDTWYKLIQPTETLTVEPGNLPTHLCDSEMTDGLPNCASVLCCSYRHDTELATVDIP